MSNLIPNPSFGVLNGSIGPLTMGTINAHSIQSGSITADKAYSRAFLREKIKQELERQRVASVTEEISDDEYEAGHQIGYDAGVQDGIVTILNLLDEL